MPLGSLGGIVYGRDCTKKWESSIGEEKDKGLGKEATPGRGVGGKIKDLPLGVGRTGGISVLEGGKNRGRFAGMSVTLREVGGQGGGGRKRAPETGRLDRPEKTIGNPLGENPSREKG